MITATTKHVQQARGVRYGCFVDSDEDGVDVSADCVLDWGGDGADCPHASRRRVRETCPFWQPWPEKADTEAEGK